MITKLSPAKVNLHLTVFGRRDDGYHDLATLMQQISLCDEMTFSPAESGVTLTCPGSPLPCGEGNLVYRAARNYLARISSDQGMSVTLKKRIPLAAGLGGGSSNAATTLIALNEYFGSPVNGEDLLKLAGELGADVPFFLFKKTAWAFGIGDELRNADPIPHLWYVLVNPRFDVSTKMVYENLNLGLTKAGIHYSIPRFYINSSGNRIEGLKNDLEGVTMNLYPQLNELKRLLLDCGALGALMSGSGPTVYGIYLRKDKALEAKKTLEIESAGEWGVYLAHSL